MVRDTALPPTIDTVVIGAGQAGLAMSWFLQGAGREHVLLERRKRLGGGWQDRWDGFCLVTPNWTVGLLPGYSYDGPDPDGFMSRDEIAGHVARYADVIEAPVVSGTEVRRLALRDDGRPGFRLETSRGTVFAGRVVVAAGGYHVPRIPSVAAGLPARVTHLHSHHYRNEGSLPPGAVLVVGSGQSGVQIAEELHEAGRRVYLSVGSAGRLPRRYRGQDIFWWFAKLVTVGPRFGLGMPTVDKLPDPRLRFDGNPALTGHGGLRQANLRRYAADGITLLGHLDGIDGERVHLAPGLSVTLDRIDRFFDERFRALFDNLAERAELDVGPDDREAFAFEPQELPELDLAEAGISTVVWTSGYRFDFSWLDAPILDEYGYPRHVRGMTEIPGLAFLGLPWLHTQASPTLFGVGADGRYLADQMGLLETQRA